MPEQGLRKMLEIMPLGISQAVDDRANLKNIVGKRKRFCYVETFLHIKTCSTLKRKLFLRIIVAEQCYYS